MCRDVQSSARQAAVSAELLCSGGCSHGSWSRWLCSHVASVSRAAAVAASWGFPSLCYGKNGLWGILGMLNHSERRLVTACSGMQVPFSLWPVKLGSWVNNVIDWKKKITASVNIWERGCCCFFFSCNAKLPSEWKLLPQNTGNIKSWGQEDLTANKYG